MPLFLGQSMLGPGNVVQELLQSLCPVGRKADCHAEGVESPTKNLFLGCPAGVTLEQLFHGDGLLAGRRVQSVQGQEDVLDGVEQNLSRSGVPWAAARKSSTKMSTEVRILARSRARFGSRVSGMGSESGRAAGVGSTLGVGSGWVEARASKRWIGVFRHFAMRSFATSVMVSVALLNHGGGVGPSHWHHNGESNERFFAVEGGEGDAEFDDVCGFHSHTVKTVG
jgi:hypothetical protein